MKFWGYVLGVISLIIGGKCCLRRGEWFVGWGSAWVESVLDSNTELSLNSNRGADDSRYIQMKC